MVSGVLAEEPEATYMRPDGDVELETAPLSSGHEIKRVTPDVRAPLDFRGRIF
jgi:hypothetical protein